MLKMDPNRRFDAGYPFSYPQVIRIRAMPYGRYTDLRDMSLYLRLIHHSSPIDAPSGYLSYLTKDVVSITKE